MAEARVPALFIATKNAGKLVEFGELLAAYGVATRRYERYADVAEGERSYAENAGLKARALRTQLVADGIVGDVLADDSGLEIEALAGRPGVVSARYGGPDVSWSQRRALLVAELDATGDAARRAAFVCALHLVAADGRERTAWGRCEGRLVSIERGNGGFSYDAIFVPEGELVTFAEMSGVQKNETSHRAQALRALFGTAASESRQNRVSSFGGGT